MTSNVLLPRRVLLEVQAGGAGSNNWKSLATLNDVSVYRVGAVDSGEVEISRWYGRDEKNAGRLTVIASYRTGTAPVYTFDVELADAQLQNILDTMNGKKNLRLRYFRGEYSNPTNYDKIRVLSRAVNKKPKGGFTRDMANSFDGFEEQADAQRRNFPHEADDFLELERVILQDIKGTVTTLAVHTVYSFGYPRDVGEVVGENQNNPGNREWLAGTAKANAGQVPKLLYTANKGGTWKPLDCTGLTDFTIKGITKVGVNIIICSDDATGGGLAYCSLDTIKAASSSVTFVRSTGIAAGTVVSAVARIDDNTAIACGANGAVYISTDGGRTFASAGSAVTANALTKIAVVDSSLQWFGGANGTLVRRYKEVMSSISVTGIGTDAVTSLGVPKGLTRGTEIFVGTAGGDVHVSVNGTDTTPIWETRAFDQSGVGSVDGMSFAGNDGEILYLIQTNGSSQSRILRDLSGGRLASDCEVISDFTSPANAGFNDIFAADENTVMVVGDVTGGQGFIGLVA